MTEKPFQAPASIEQPSLEIEKSDEFPSIDTRTTRTTKLGCPSCEHRLYTKVGFTVWGGFIGPRLLNHVKCNQCATTYNRRTGKSNLVPIIIYGVVVALIVFVAISAIRNWALQMVQP